MWPQALFTEWHPSLAWNKMFFCFWLFCGTHHYSVWISQQSWWINPHNVPSDVWNDFNSSLKKIMRQMMWLFRGHTGNLYQRQEDNLDLFILRGAKHLLNSSYRRSTPRIRALPADPQFVCSINAAGTGYHGQGPHSHHTVDLILRIGKSGSEHSSLQDLQSPWRYSDHQHGEGQSYDILLLQSFARISPPDLHSLGFLPMWGILYYIFPKSIKQG